MTCSAQTMAQKLFSVKWTCSDKEQSWCRLHQLLQSCHNAEANHTRSGLNFSFKSICQHLDYSYKIWQFWVQFWWKVTLLENSSSVSLFLLFPPGSSSQVKSVRGSSFTPFFHIITVLPTLATIVEYQGSPFFFFFKTRNRDPFLDMIALLSTLVTSSNGTPFKLITGKSRPGSAGWIQTLSNFSAIQICQTFQQSRFVKPFWFDLICQTFGSTHNLLPPVSGSSFISAHHISQN